MDAVNCVFLICVCLQPAFSHPFPHTSLGHKHDMSAMWAMKQWQRKHKARQCSQTASITSIITGRKCGRFEGALAPSNHLS